MHREDDGAVQFWRNKENLQKYLLYCPHWSESKWKKSMAGGGGNKKRFQYCTDSGCNLVDPTLQDNVVIPSNFFQYIYHVGCAINLHSIISSRLIPGGQNLSKRQTVFFLPVDGQGDGVPKAGPQQAAADSRGSRTCKHLLGRGVAHAGREG